MHDPLTVALQIPRPWPQRSTLAGRVRPGTRWRIRFHHTHTEACRTNPPHRDGPAPWWRPSSYSPFTRLAGRDYYWPALIIIWHREPGGRNALTVCRKRRRRPDGTWTLTGGWRWHIHHWRIQIPALQELRRRLLTRCTWCGGRSTKTDPVNVSHSWHGPRRRWWRGAPGLYHRECSAISSAHSMCTCRQPVLEHDGYGHCARCNLHRPYGITPETVDRMRELAAIPPGGRLDRPRHAPAGTAREGKP